MTTEERVKQVLRKAMLLEDAEFSPNMRLAEDLGITSLDRFDLVMGIEEEFGIELTSEEQENVVTVGDLVERVKQHRGT